MVSPSFVISLKGNIGLLHGLLVNQGRRWHTSVRWSLRFIGFWFFWAYAASIGLLLGQIPYKSFELLLSHAFEPIPAVLIIIITSFSLVIAASVHAAEKLRESL